MKNKKSFIELVCDPSMSRDDPAEFVILEDLTLSRTMVSSDPL